MGFPRQEYWSGLPFPSPGDLPDPGTGRLSLASPALAGGFFTAVATWRRNLFYVFEMFGFPSQTFYSAGQWITLEPYRDLGEKYAFICECLFKGCCLSEASLDSSRKHQNFLFFILSVPCVYMKVLAPDYCLCLIWAFYSQNPAC